MERTAGKGPPAPPDERERLQALRAYQVLDTPPEEAFDGLTRLAAHICRSPIALINLVDAERVWSKSNLGLLATQVAREDSFCAHAIGLDAPLVVADAPADERFAALPMVASDPGVRSYLGAPLITPSGHAVGTICVMDREPRTPSVDHIAALQALARQVVTQLEFRRNLREMELAAERHRITAETLRETEARYRSLVETVPAVVYLDEYNEASSTVYISPQVQHLLGYAAVEWKTDRELWVKILHPDDRDRALAEQEELLRTGRPWDDEYRMISRDGRVVWVHDQAVVVRDDAGRPLAWQGIWLDITARKETEEDLHEALERELAAVEELRRLDEVKNALLHAVSHDLKSPITSMLGLAITLERDEANLTPRERQEIARGLVSSARRMYRLVNDLLDLERLDRGVVAPKRHPTDVGELVRRVVEELAAITDRTVELDARPVIVAVDGPKVERVVENLLANATRHTPSGTRVWAKVEPFSAGVLITVEDTGPGVPPELRETIFEPFRQGSPGEGPGVGIGLSLVAQFAELHSGRAWVEDRPGGGASFRVYLPDGPAEPESASLSLDEPPTAD